MPGERPYDPHQLTKLTQEITGSSSHYSKPVREYTHEPSVVDAPDFERFTGPNKLARAAKVIGNFIGSSIRVISPDGLVERAEERVARFEKRMEVAAWLGERIASPRTPPGRDETEKIGWVGTHKATLGRASSKDAAGWMGNALLDIKNVGTTPETPNLLRPSTRAERDRDRRLEATIEKARRLRRNARWSEETYGDRLRGNVGQRLRPREAKHMSSVARDIERGNRGAARLEAQFNRTANYQDPRGKVLRWRLERARSFPARQQARYDRAARAVYRTYAALKAIGHR